MVGLQAGYRRNNSTSLLAWCKGQRPLGAALQSSNEPGELSQWLCHNDSTINIGICIIISIIALFCSISDIKCDIKIRDVVFTQ